MPSSENIILGFTKAEFKGVAIDAYITKKSLVDRSVADKEFTIGYKKIKDDKSLTKKFATLMILRGYPALVLHIGEKKDKRGLLIQKQIDEKLSYAYQRNEMQIREKSHEVFIRLDWVRSLDEISSFIDEAYELRK